MNHKIKHLATWLCIILSMTAASCKPEGAGASGGGVTLPGASGNGGKGGGATAGVISADEKPLDVMTKAMRAQLDAKSYRAHVTYSTPDGDDSKMLIEYVAPDRYRMTGEGTGFRVERRFKMEYVIVGDVTYVKTPNGDWVKSPFDAGVMIKAFRNHQMLDELAKTADVKFVGTDTLDGAPMLVYQYTQNDPMSMNLMSTSKVWLSVADGLPRKTESESEIDGKKAKVLITMSDYNADIKIESPVK